MGFVTLGIFAFNMQGMDGAMMVMLAHGFNTGGLFLCVGVIYERAHTRDDLPPSAGWPRACRSTRSIFGVFMLAIASVCPVSPASSASSWSILGAFMEYNAGRASSPSSVVIFSAWYMMWMFQRVVFGRASGEEPDPHDNALPAVSGASTDEGHAVMSHEATNKESPAHSRVPQWADVTPQELVTLVPLLILALILGVWPGPFMEVMQSTLEAILVPFGAAGV